MKNKKYKVQSASLLGNCSGSKHLWNSWFCTTLDIIARCGLSLRFRNNTAEVLCIFLPRYHINQHFIHADCKTIIIILIPWKLQQEVLPFYVKRGHMQQEFFMKHVQITFKVLFHINFLTVGEQIKLGLYITELIL